MKQRIMALVLALVMCVGLAMSSAFASPAGPVDMEYIRSLPLREGNWIPMDGPVSVTGINTLGDSEEEATADPLVDMDYIRSLPLREGNWVPMDVNEDSVTPAVLDNAAYNAAYAMLQGKYDQYKVYVDADAGGYYYAVSPATTRSAHRSVSVNIQLPAHLENGSRTAFISLGINNDGLIGTTLKFIDLGLGRVGDQWYVTKNGNSTGTPGYSFNDGSLIHKDAKNVIMTLDIVDEDTLELYAQAYTATGPIGDYFKGRVDTSGWNLNGNISFFRFASLFGYSGVNDGTYMAGGAFLNCFMHSPNNTSYAWGIKSDTQLIKRAWIVNTAHISVTPSGCDEVFEIFHY